MSNRYSLSKPWSGLSNSKMGFSHIWPSQMCKKRTFSHNSFMPQNVYGIHVFTRWYLLQS